MRFGRAALCFCALFWVAACGGASTGGNDAVFSLSPATFTIEDDRLTFDRATGLVELNEVDVSRPTDPVVGDATSAARVQRANNGYLTARANRVEVFAFYTVGNSFSARGNHGGVFGRTTPYELAGDTKASLTGRYAGMLIDSLGNGSAQGVRETVNGDVALDIDLSSGDITGTVNNRRTEVVGVPGLIGSLGDLTIRTAFIDRTAGAFVADVESAPSILRSPTNPLAFIRAADGQGAAQGVIGGDDEQIPELAGVLGVVHRTASGQTIISERGAFYVE